jgi:hypothetical protein
MPTTCVLPISNAADGNSFLSRVSKLLVCYIILTVISKHRL